MEITKVYKIRLYPNKAQEQTLLQIIGGCRFLYNFFLEKRKEYYLDHGKTIPYGELSKEIKVLRKQIEWLGQIQAEPLYQSLRRLEIAYRRGFRKLSNFPRFKSKKDFRQSFQKHQDWRITEKLLVVQGDLKIKFRGQINHAAKMGTLVVLKSSTGKWYASITAKEEYKQPKRYTKPIGLDVGISSLVVTSDGKKYDNFQPQKTLQAKLTKAQRSLEKKVKWSGRYQKSKKEVAKVYEKIVNVRQNYLHQVSNAIVRKNHAMIAVENLNVKGMMKNHNVARAMVDASLSELLKQIHYKQEWRGGIIVKVGRFFPSSKTCSNCGEIVKELALSVRKWNCQSCGSRHDRDINAAKNILKEAVAYTERGEGGKVVARREIPASMKRRYMKV